MKKNLSVIISILLMLTFLTLPSLASTKAALPTSAGIGALRGQFQSGKAPKTDGFALDYEYYSPVGDNDTNKYPLVIFLHGIGHGESVGSQLRDSDMPYWASSELQSRFTDGGAFILLPRAPENLNMFWGESLIDPLRALIDDFIKQHKNNIDTTRIAISGSSQGGTMVWMMLKSYPEYFATAFPLASTEAPTANNVKAAAGTAIWLFASSKDPVVSYSLSTLPTWNKILENNARPELCRLTTLGTVYNPDGSRSSDNHHIAKVITYDLKMLSGAAYPETSTQNGLGATVNTNSDGIIKWISSVHSGFNGNTTGESTANVFNRILEAFRNFFLQIVHLFQMMFGL